MVLGENLMAHQKSLVMIVGGLRSAPSSLTSREMFLVVWGLFTGHRRPWEWFKSLGLIHKTEDVGNHVHIRFAAYFKHIMFEIFWVSYITSLSIRLGGSSWFRPHPRAIAPWLCRVVLSMDELKDVLKSGATDTAKKACPVDHGRFWLRIWDDLVYVSRRSSFGKMMIKQWIQGVYGNSPNGTCYPIWNCGSRKHLTSYTHGGWTVELLNGRY